MVEADARSTAIVKPQDGRQRVQFENVYPDVDQGRFPIKRVVGESVHVYVDMFADGHDAIAGVVRYRCEDDETWQEVPLQPLENDRWRGQFAVDRVGFWHYSFVGWIDGFATWFHGLTKKVAADQDVTVDLQIGADWVERATQTAADGDRDALWYWIHRLRSAAVGVATEVLTSDLPQIMQRHPDRRWASPCDRTWPVWVDRVKARYSTWYELFPRSCGEPGRHGTFADCAQRLPYIAELGFDVLYLPPIHPIGTTFRKGKNNALVAEPEDVGVPWGIGSAEGGHKSIHPQLGTLADFHALRTQAATYGIEIALDLALQCSPDHPYVHSHPQWFRRRPDGTIQYAENPPKKYQDIYPIDFETEDWANLWDELLSILVYWVEQGVKIFRVDNPHTKAFPFWEWAIAEVHRRDREVIFLSEAFTRPKLMYRLAKLGFTQSYTYFTWRNTKWELETYLTELTQSPVREFFRPNFWPNTPDILPESLQKGGQPAFKSRVVLAATLAASYGIYGPAYELCENRPIAEGKEEYAHSEKYELKAWDLQSPYSIARWIATLNRIRRAHPCLQTNENLRFHAIGNEQLLAYTKHTEDGSDVILVVVNLDAATTQAGWLDLPLESLGVDPYRPYQVHDLLAHTHYDWYGGRNYVELNPHHQPAHVFHLIQNPIAP
jgi:starch synthase (maltosyl-transferring)